MRFIMSCTDRKETEKRPEADNIKKPGDGFCVWLQIRRNNMAVRKEMVLYYTPEKSADDQKLKGVLVRLGIRIRNITPEQIQQKVGYLAGLPGFEEETEKEPEACLERAAGQPETPQEESSGASRIPEKMLVLYGFGERKLNEMLNQFRKAKVPPIALKAVLTEHNCGWSFYELYQELRQEHEKMTAAAGGDSSGKAGAVESGGAAE